jgi:hypothetical protein
MTPEDAHQYLERWRLVDQPIDRGRQSDREVQRIRKPLFLIDLGATKMHHRISSGTNPLLSGHLEVS